MLPRHKHLVFNWGFSISILASVFAMSFILLTIATAPKGFLQ